MGLRRWVRGSCTLSVGVVPHRSQAVLRYIGMSQIHLKVLRLNIAYCTAIGAGPR